jgi:hypothetical protein
MPVHVREYSQIGPQRQGEFDVHHVADVHLSPRLRRPGAVLRHAGHPAAEPKVESGSSARPAAPDSAANATKNAIITNSILAFLKRRERMPPRCYILQIR